MDPDRSQHGRLIAAVRSQQVAFLAVGGVNTLMGFALFAAAHSLLGAQIGYMGSLAAAYSVAILIAFQLQRRFVFKVAGHWWRDLARFTAVNATALASNAVSLPLLVEAGGLDPIPAQAVALGLSTVFSFFAHKHFTFARPSQPHGSTAWQVNDDAPS